MLEIFNNQVGFLNIIAGLRLSFVYICAQLAIFLLLVFAQQFVLGQALARFLTSLVLFGNSVFEGSDHVLIVRIIAVQLRSALHLSVELWSSFLQVCPRLDNFFARDVYNIVQLFKYKVFVVAKDLENWCGLPVDVLRVALRKLSTQIGKDFVDLTGSGPLWKFNKSDVLSLAVAVIILILEVFKRSGWCDSSGVRWVTHALQSILN